MRRIGILGGTFNPIHNGHLYIAAEAYRQLGLDEVWIMPVGIPPHKEPDGGISRMQRLAMCEEAVRQIPYMRVYDEELRSDGKSYSYLTLTRLRDQYPNDSFYFIIGEDSLDMFTTWSHPQVIADCATLAVAIRHDEDVTLGTRAAVQRLQELYGARIELLETDYIDISSSDIRDMLSSDEFIYKREEELEFLLPAPVLRYIREHRIYCTRKGLKMSPKEPRKPSDFLRIKLEIEQKLQKKLKPARFTHTLGVAYTAAALAMAHDYPMDVAFISGLLHDCAKYLSPDELLEFCKKKNLPISEAEEKSPQLLHAKVGAYLAEHEYGITDTQILHAISVHTTGIPEMSLLDEILFTADYIEPNRDKARRLTEIRECAFRDFHLAISMILCDTIEYLQQSGKEIDETTYRTYEYYKEHK